MLDISKNRLFCHDTRTNQDFLTWSNVKGEVLLTNKVEGLFPGEYLFELKDTMGLPLEFSASTVLNKEIKIEWPSFIEKARKAGWWDFQTYEVLLYLEEELSEYKEYMQGVIDRFKIYVLKYPHPALN
jgi:hypothetical protein